MQRQARFTPGGPRTRQDTKTTKDQGSLERLGGYSEGQSTRSHSELGRENPQRLWYCVLRRGRVGRCQVFQARHPLCDLPPGDPLPGGSPGDLVAAGWSSPVARQAHNLKVTGSNPVPASILICTPNIPRTSRESPGITTPWATGPVPAPAPSSAAPPDEPPRVCRRLQLPNRMEPL